MSTKSTLILLGLALAFVGLTIVVSIGTH